jgi:hypothetical protein
MIALMCLEIMLKIMLVRCKKLTTINAAVISRLIFIIYKTMFIEHSS